MRRTPAAAEPALWRGERNSRREGGSGSPGHAALPSLQRGAARRRSRDGAGLPRGRQAALRRGTALGRSSRSLPRSVAGCVSVRPSVRPWGLVAAPHWRRAPSPASQWHSLAFPVAAQGKAFGAAAGRPFGLEVPVRWRGRGCATRPELYRANKL